MEKASMQQHKQDEIEKDPHAKINSQNNKSTNNRTKG
jgi:hypothetical protein